MQTDSSVPGDSEVAKVSNLAATSLTHHESVAHHDASPAPPASDGLSRYGPESPEGGPPRAQDGGTDEVIGRAFRWSLAVLALLACGVAGFVVWLKSGIAKVPDHVTDVKAAAEATAEAAGKAAQVAAKIPRVRFTDMTKAAGIDFVHVNGSEGELLFPEFMGAAVVLFDYDNDGDLDIFFTNGQYWPWASKTPAGAKQPTMALYRNDGNWKFTDVSETAGLKFSYYAMGAAAADYDNDGDLDLFVAAVGPNHLYRNDGGRFVEVTAQAGVSGPPEAFSTCCGWFDYDRDGDLDLIVLNYIVWSRQINNERLFRLEYGVRGNVRPQLFEGQPSFVYRNEGNGLFSDVSESCGVRVMGKHTKKPLGKSMGLCITDLDGDKWLDMVVANDTDRNFAFLNNRDGTFREVAEEIGVAYGPRGVARSGMGIDIADFRNNGTLGIGIGNFVSEMCSLFVSSHRPEELPALDKVRFTDEAIAAGVSAATAPHVTFGVFFFDADLDGWQDFLCCNGHVDPDVDRVESHVTYAQQPLLFWNCGGQGNCDFVPMTQDHVGQDFLAKIVGRGAAFGDLDGDGDLDIVLTACDGAARLLRNDQQLGHHFLRFKLVGTHSDREAIGALIEVKTNAKTNSAKGGTQTMRQRVFPFRGYFAQSEAVVTFGLGRDARVDSVRIVWPRGNEQVLNTVTPDRLMVIHEEVLRER